MRTFGPASFISRADIADIVKTLDNRKSPGADEIPYKTLKTLHCNHPAMLKALFNGCIQARHFTTLWKFRRAVMIPKPDLEYVPDMPFWNYNCPHSPKNVVF